MENTQKSQIDILNKEIEKMKADSLVSDIVFFSDYAERLVRWIKNYPKLSQEKRNNAQYEYATKHYQEVVLTLNNLIEKYEKQKTAEKFFSEVK